jgi:chitin synthase
MSILLGPDGWKQFVVVIVADGILKANPRALKVMEVMGIYAENITRSSIDGQKVEAHIFEMTTQVSVNIDYKIKTYEDGVVPTQVIFVMKEENAKKINSHKWFFNAICRSIQPDVTLLLDCGTKPSSTSLMHLYRAVERNPRCGGACGEIKAELGLLWHNLVNPLVAAQK